MDAEKIDLENIDVIVSFETIYYLKDIMNFFHETYRALSNEGFLIICTANKDWSAFNPSPFSTRYLSVDELYQLATFCGFKVSMYASFPDLDDGPFPKLTAFLKRTAIKYGMIPKTMKGKVLLKKIFNGNLVTYPPKIKCDLFEYTDPAEISPDRKNTTHTAIFAVCKK